MSGDSDVFRSSGRGVGCDNPQSADEQDLNEVPPSAPVVYVLGPSVETLVAGDPWAEPSVWVVLGLLLLCCFLCLLCLLFWLCCGRPGKEKLYVYQVPDLPMKQVEVAFRA